jgi:hypothetical protein
MRTGLKLQAKTLEAGGGWTLEASGTFQRSKDLEASPRTIAQQMTNKK